MGASSAQSRPLPAHVALIMDGNRRWAQLRKRSHEEAYRAGMEAARRLIEHAAERRIRVLTLFTFSNENRNRHPQEVALLLRLFGEALTEQAQELLENGVRLRFLGEIERLAPELRRRIEHLDDQAPSEPGLTVCVAMYYGGRQDLLQAAARCQDDGVEVNEAAVDERLSTAGLPEPDLLIRTGGECRLSNFLLWQMAYTELYFTDTLWPDFDETKFDAALEWYAHRDRRFGVSGA